MRLWIALAELPGHQECQKNRRQRRATIPGHAHCLTLGGTGRTISRIFQTAALPTALVATQLDSDDRRGFTIHDG